MPTSSRKSSKIDLFTLQATIQTQLKASKLELQSRIFELEEFQEQLDSFVEFLAKENIPQILVAFGFAWGNELGDGQWNPEVIESARLLDRIREVEDSGVGKFGDDEIIVEIPGDSLSITFCHERDIHLKYAESIELAARLNNLYKGEWLS